MINKQVVDIVLFLNTDELSPYKGKFTLPYSKDYVELNYHRTKPLIYQCIKVLNLYKIPNDKHKFIFINYLMAIKDSYNSDWDDENNPFLRYFGFDILMDMLKMFIKEAYFIRDFSKESFYNLLYRNIDLEKITKLNSWGEGYIRSKFIESINETPIDKIEIKY